MRILLGTYRSRGTRCSGSLGGARAADFGVARLDDGVDEMATLVIGEEGALHRVEGNFFEVLEGEAKGLLSGLEFVGHGGVAHEAVIGI